MVASSGGENCVPLGSPLPGSLISHSISILDVDVSSLSVLLAGRTSFDTQSWSNHQEEHRLCLPQGGL
jgi:hypothetical protein